MLQLSQKYVDFVNKLYFIFLCLVVPKMKKVVANVSSAIVICFALRVKF